MAAKRNAKAWVAVTGAVLLVWGCSRSPDSPVVARVGDAVLTLEDLYRSIPPEYRDRITREQNVNYVNQWIQTELLYQEALKRKLHKRPDVRLRLSQMERNMLSAELLGSEQSSTAAVMLADSTVRQYYEQNRDMFARPEEAIRLVQLVVESYGTAASLKSQVNPQNFLTIAAQHSITPVDDPRSAPFVPIGELPEAFVAPLRTAQPGATVGPVKMDDEYYLLHVLDRQPAGSISLIDEVRDQIVDQLTSQRQKMQVERLVSSLRMQTNVTYHFDVIPGARSPAPDTAGY
jgi:parvulin-like peptidyl-prolyl isomerase